jgi:hypothetical protein
MFPSFLFPGAAGKAALARRAARGAGGDRVGTTCSSPPSPNDAPNCAQSSGALGAKHTRVAQGAAAAGSTPWWRYFAVGILLAGVATFFVRRRLS